MNVIEAYLNIKYNTIKIIITTIAPHPDCRVSRNESPLLLNNNPNNNAKPMITIIKCIIITYGIGEF